MRAAHAEAFGRFLWGEYGVLVDDGECRAVADALAEVEQHIAQFGARLGLGEVIEGFELVSGYL